LLTLSVSGQGVKVGDLIENKDGSKGIVFWLSPDATYGWMVATEAKELTAPFQGNFPGLSSVANRSGAMQDTAGYGNTAHLLETVGSWTEFASLAADFRNGWYIPSLGQLRKLLSLGCRLPIELGSEVYVSSTRGKDNFWVATRWGETKTQSDVVAYFPVRTFSLVEYDMTLSYRWNTGALTPEITERPVATTTYEVTATTPVGCYAKAKQTVFAASVTPETVEETICRGEVYRRYGIEASESGEYRGTLTNAAGCEQEVIVRLKVNEPVETVLEASIRAGEVYRENGFTEWEAGEHRQVWQRANGCDSTVILQLAVHPLADTLIRDTVCAGSAYREHGFNLAAVTEGQQIEPLHLTNRWGDDSIVRLELQVNPVSRMPLPPVSVCAGESYAFFGETLTRTGTYYHTLTNQWGCDSILELNFTVRPLDAMLIRDTVCAGSVYREHGFNLAAVTEGQRTELLHLTNRWGCDSTVRLELQVNPVLRTVLAPEYICSDESYSFFGDVLTETGTYYHTLPNRWGCDSVVELNLTVYPVHDTLFRDTVCAGSAYKEHGFNLAAETEGQRMELLHLTNRWGCDSTVRLELWVNPVSRTVLAPEYICSGGSYSFFGEALTETGTYYHTLPNRWGCDSVVELNLTVSENFEGSLRAELTDCALHEYAFTADWGERTPVEGSRYEWNFGDGESRETETPSVRYAYVDTGMYVVRLKVVTPGDCFRKREETVHIPYYLPELAVYSSPENLDVDRPDIRLWTDSVAGMRYTWDFGDGSTGYGWSVEHTYVFQKREMYRIVLESLNEEDCPARKEFTLHAYVTIEPPNTITPNGDGINDYFMRGYRVRIFNRNGVEIFRGDDGWDGLRDGQPVPEDTYFYEVYYLTPGGEKSKMGYVMVVR